MSFNILYYPHIDIPDESWLRRVLLYSDCIGSIVPNELLWDIEGDPVIRLLKDSGEYQAFSSEDFLRHDPIVRSEFETDVRQTFEHNRSNIRQGLSKTVVETTGAKMTKMHRSKFTYKMKHFFEKEDLISAGTDEWFNMDELAAATYLGVLAKYIGEKYRFTPGTDNDAYERYVFNVASSGDMRHVANMRVYDLLPCPVNETPLTEILKFKRERRDELNQFQKVVFDVQSRVANAADRVEQNDILNQFERDLLTQVSQLAKLLEDTRISFRWSSFKTMFETLTTPQVTSVLVPTSTVLATSNSSMSRALITSAGGLVTLGFGYVNLKARETAHVRNSTHAYIFQAQRNGIVRQTYQTNPPRNRR